LKPLDSGFRPLLSGIFSKKYVKSVAGQGLSG
jgi:hypothetical protein